MVDLNYNYESDWLIELSDNKLSDNNLASELVESRTEFLKPITIDEIIIFMIKREIVVKKSDLFLKLSRNNWHGEFLLSVK